MKRALVMTMVLAFSLWAVAQATQSVTSSSSTPVSQAPQVLVTGPGGLSTNTGTAVIIAPPSAPLVVTPEFHLAPTVTAIGATNATPGNTAGAVNATAAMPLPPRIITTVPQFSTTGATVYQTLPPQETIATAAAAGATGTVAAGAPVIIVNGHVLFDRGVGSGSSLVAGGDTGGKSLGEIARENRQREAGVNPHVYTNQDIERVSSQPGIQVGGMTGAAVGAGNATGTQQHQQPSNMPAVSQPSANPPQNPNPGVSQPVPPSNNPPDQSQANPSGALEQMQGEREMAQANPPANPADRNAPPPSAGVREPSGNQLPSGGSILPLMAVVGVLAAGAGLLAR